MISLSIAMMRVPFWLASPPGKRRNHERAFFSRAVRGFGISLSLRGQQPSPQSTTLFIMNHISWADIPVMMAILDADFVAKADVMDWPILGRLAKRFNPVFVARNELHRSHNQVDQIRARLRAGRSVILCAEGTTSDGSSILPFRSSLFAAADAAHAVQPIILRYLSPKGDALPPERQRAVAWIDDDELLSGAIRFAREATLARVEFLPSVAANGDRKRLAETVRNAMLAAYAAAPNRPK
jgi:lyso-ornithine lipid O-acyltransferase